MRNYLQKADSRILGLLNLCVIFTIWSSTFLAIRLAVSGEKALTPFFMGFGRMAFAGLFLLLIGVLTNKRLRPEKEELRLIFFSSVFVWGGGASFLTWGMQYEPSGIAALVTASIPVFVALIAAVASKKQPSGVLGLSLMLGFTGLLIIVKSSLSGAVAYGLTPLIALVCSAFCCAIGFYMQSGYTTRLSPVVLAGYQLTLSSLVFLSLMLLLHEPVHYPSTRSLLAWLYLTFATGVGVIAFGNILRLLPVNIAMTYAYVNPVLALLWGWCFLNEQLSSTTFFGAILVIIGVMGVFRDNNN